jgi:hypothetical protein
MATLFPAAPDKARVDAALLDLWNALAPHGCGACHGAPGGDGWGRHQMPYWLQWKSQAVALLGTLDPGVAKVNPRDIKLFALLSGSLGTPMPPPRGLVVPADTVLLEALDTSSPDELPGALSRIGRTTADLRAGLGTEIVYANAKGTCFDRRNTGADPWAESICSPFEAIAAFASTWKGDAGKSIAAWNAVANQAAGVPHYDALEGVVDDEKPVTLTGTKVVASVTRVGDETIYGLPAGVTVSFYVQPAPDDSLLAFTRTDGRVALAPQAFWLADPGDSTKGADFFADGMRYDPIFSPGFDFKRKRGFVIGAAGVKGSDDSKNFYVYRSTGKRLERLRFTNPVDDIAGYQTIARIDDATKVNARWANLVGKYVIMGKRWRWFAVEEERNTAGETTGLKRTTPSGTGTLAPICATLTGERGDRIKSFDTSDSMISPDGRWLSLRQGSGLTRALLIVSTKDCAVIHVPKIAGKPVSAGKAAFSHDGRFVAFHAFGSDGTQDDPMAFHNMGLPKKHADNGKVSNIFLFDTDNGRLEQVTFHAPGAASSYVALFPTFNGDATRLYYHRHGKGKSASEIVVRANPLEVFR